MLATSSKNKKNSLVPACRLWTCAVFVCLFTMGINWIFWGFGLKNKPNKSIFGVNFGKLWRPYSRFLIFYQMRNQSHYKISPIKLRCVSVYVIHHITPDQFSKQTLVVLMNWMVFFFSSHWCLFISAWYRTQLKSWNSLLISHVLF